GSFHQSKMFAKGVTCSDCHEPHRLKLRAGGNGVCLQCHAAEKYVTTTHSFHGKAVPPVSCVDCHMPTRTYMCVHVRHDHSFRIPRPDRSSAQATPNACNQCHGDKPPTWAASAIEGWYGLQRQGFQNFGEALNAARADLPTAAALLHRAVADPLTPSI